MVQRIKLHLAVSRLGVLLVPLVKFQNTVSSQAILSDDPGDKRIDLLFQFGNCATVNTQLGGSPVLVHSVFVGVQKLPHTVFDNPATVGNIGNLHRRIFEEVSHAVHQGVVVNRVGNFGGADGELVRHCDLLHFFQVGCAGKADDGVDSSPLSPVIDDGPQLDFVADRMMYFVDENRQGGQFTD